MLWALAQIGFYLFFFLIFMAIPMTYGGSWANNQIRAAAAAYTTAPTKPGCFCFLLFRSAYGSSQARGQIGTAAADLHHNHSNSNVAI